MSWKEEVTARFSNEEAAPKWNRMYEENTASLDDENFRLRRDFAVDYIESNIDKSARILDLGCGAAPVTYELLKRGYDVVGLDYSPDMLENARQRLISGGFTNADQLLFRGNGERTPFEDEAFDCVVCLGVISYVEEYENIIKEIFRVLKPGGVVLISFRNKYNLVANDPVGLSKFLMKKTLMSLGLRGPDKFKIGRYMDAKEVKGAAAKCGLEFQSFKGIGFGPYSFWHRKLFSEDTSIKISRKITSFANKIGAGFAFRLAADVNILIFRKNTRST